MPGRLLVMAIVVFWLAATGWMFYRDVWPWLGPGEPPPFTIDLADEALGQASETQWKILKDDQEKGYANTKVLYSKKADDTFELYCEFHLWSKVLLVGDPDQLIKSVYRVTREGELREIKAYVKLKLLLNKELTIEADLEGEVKDQYLAPHVEIKSDGTILLQQDLAPVEVSSRGSVLNPMQPLNRIAGLRKGQHWRMPIVDPLDDVMRAYHPLGNAASVNAKSLEAEVLPQAHMLVWGLDDAEVPCLVIEYRGDDVTARTWVRESDRVVLQQEVTRRGDKLTLVRVQR